MTRKDYIALAAALRGANPEPSMRSVSMAAAASEAWRVVVVAIADTLAADNGRFDRERFYRAAGMPTS